MKVVWQFQTSLSYLGFCHFCLIFPKQAIIEYFLSQFQNPVSTFERLYKFFPFFSFSFPYVDKFLWHFFAFALFSSCLILSFSYFSAFLSLFVSSFLICCYFLNNFNEKHFLLCSICHPPYWNDFNCSCYFIVGA